MGRPVGTGGPNGPQKGRFFTEALRVVLKRVELDDMGVAKQNFMIIAEKLVEEAKNGEAWAIKEVMDRCEGRVPVAIFPEENDVPKLKHVKISFVEPQE